MFTTLIYTITSAIEYQRLGLQVRVRLPHEAIKGSLSTAIPELKFETKARNFNQYEAMPRTSMVHASIKLSDATSDYNVYSAESGIPNSKNHLLSIRTTLRQIHEINLRKPRPVREQVQEHDQCRLTFVSATSKFQQQRCYASSGGWRVRYKHNFVYIQEESEKGSRLWDPRRSDTA